MSFVKAKLKATRESIAKKDYAAARDAALQVLEHEPENYTANVFLGLAQLELGEHIASEQAYRAAIAAAPTQPLAWQGLERYLERTETWEGLADARRRLVDVFCASGDAVKCAEALQRLVALRRERGTRAQLIAALALYLPDSPCYAVLATLPPPDPTNPTASTIAASQAAMHDPLPLLEELAALAEAEDAAVHAREVARRRTRLGAAGPAQLARDVGREVWGISMVPRVYDEILNHPSTPDSLRRATEAKLLRRTREHMQALPSGPEKARLAKALADLVGGAVLLGVPDELAWALFIDGTDCDDIEGYGIVTLRRLVHLFPTRPLALLVRGYFIYAGIPLEGEDNSDDENVAVDANAEIDEDPLGMIVDAFPALGDSILAHRILAEIYVHEVDYQNAIKVAEGGLELVRHIEEDTGNSIPQVHKAFTVLLATALVHLFPPKHHTRALRLLDSVLQSEPHNIPCLMGRAYVLQAAQRWADAAAIFAEVPALAPDDLQDGLRAREEVAWCDSHVAGPAGAVPGLQDVLEVLDSLEGRDVDRARCLWRLGRCHWDMGGEEREKAYKCFVLALKRDSAYAPAFTSLGIYYAECASPPDPTRASKCFQKAFELDAREADAARRLAEGFAEEREWDLVEVVARRTIDGEGGMDAGLAGTDGVVASRYLPTNAWAWKALGVVELTRRNYAPAIQAFQVALRADGDDQLLWLRLGEAYSRAGRHAAAIKALARAHELQPDDWMCSYFIGEVQRQVGQYAEAVASFEAILDERPAEIGVLMSLGQTYLDLGRSELTAGYSARAEQSFVACVHAALRTVSATAGFRGVAWKTAADAVFFLARRSSFADEEEVRAVLHEVAAVVSAHTSERLAGLVSVVLPHADEPLGGTHALAIAVAAYDYRVALGSPDSATSGSALFDLGVALHRYSLTIADADKQVQAGKTAAGCITDALRADPGNDTYWNALGNVHFAAQPRTAQHAYIKALEIDNKNVITWANLGLLYLHHDDLELANEALLRAQTLDPDYTVAWVGQALVATANGHDNEAKALLEHAVGLTADVPEADLAFASRVFAQLRTGDPGALSDALFPAFFVLGRYCQRRPDDASALHLYGLVCERLGHAEAAGALIARAIAILETAYEESEDPTVERQFTVATANLARLRLAGGGYEEALEGFEAALALLPDAGEAEDDAATRVLRVQAQLGAGLAQLRQGAGEAALAQLEAAVEAAGDDALLRSHATVLLAQALWAHGTPATREAAKAQLLDCIAADPESLPAITALAGTGILTADAGLVDAALAELRALPPDRRAARDPPRAVDRLLAAHYLADGAARAALGCAQRAVAAEPARGAARVALARLALQMGEGAAAGAVLPRGGGVEAARDAAGLRAVAEARAGGAEARAGGAEARGALRGAQRGVVLAPWDARAWRTLAYVRGATAGDM